MRRSDADLEEKREPRVTSSARAQKSDGIKSSDWSLTSAAIEKETFAGTRGNDRVAPIAAVRRTSGTEGSRRQRPFADASLIVPIDNLWEGRVDTV